MDSTRTLLVPIDGSDFSAYSVDFALRLAKRSEAAVLFCHSVDLTGAIASCSNPYGSTDVAPILAALEDDCKALLSEALARASGLAIAATAVELSGSPVGAILDALRARRVDAIVLGTHGRSGVSRFFLGSTAEGVLRRSDVPVFVVSQRSAVDAASGAAFSRIVVAVDDSDPSDAALDAAMDLADPGTTTMVLVHVVNVRETYALAASQRYAATAAIEEERQAAEALLATAAERVRARGITAVTTVLEGEPAESLLEVARAQQADLVAIGTHGRRGIRRLLIGSVAEGVVRACPVPTLVVRRRVQAVATNPPGVGAPLESATRAPHADAPRETVLS